MDVVAVQPDPGPPVELELRKLTARCLSGRVRPTSIDILATMRTADVESWFTTYLADYAAMVRGDHDDLRRLLGHYHAPLLMSTDASCVTLADEEQVAAAVQRQVDDLRAADYDRSEQVTASPVVLNRTCATHRVLLSRLRRDGSEIARLEATYLITEAVEGRRIAAIVVHSAP